MKNKNKTPQSVDKLARAMACVGCIVAVLTLAFYIHEVNTTTKYALPNIRIEWYPKGLISRGTNPLETYYRNAYYFIPIRIKNISSIDSTLTDIQLSIDNIQNYSENSLTFDIYVWDADGGSLVATLEKESFLKKLELPLRVSAMDVVDGYVVFDAHTNLHEADFSKSKASLVYSTSYSDKEVAYDILSKNDE